MAAPKVSTNAIVKIDGTTIKVMPGLKVMMGNPELEAVVAADGSVQYKETPQAGGFDFTAIAANDTTLATLLALDGGTVTAEFLDSGKVYTGGNAKVTNRLEVGDGQIPVTIACNPVIEQ